MSCQNKGWKRRDDLKKKWYERCAERVSARWKLFSLIERSRYMNRREVLSITFHFPFRVLFTFRCFILFGTFYFWIILTLLRINTEIWTGVSWKYITKIYFSKLFSYIFMWSHMVFNSNKGYFLSDLRIALIQSKAIIA